MEKKNWEDRYWGLLESISSAFYGKVAYHRQEDGTVYSSISEENLTLDDAEKELVEKIAEL